MKYLKICPKCGSIDIKIPPAALDFRLTIPDYCTKCKNRGIFPEVEITQISKFKKNLKK